MNSPAVVVARVHTWRDIMQAPKFIILKYISAYRIFSISGERKFYRKYIW